MTTDQMPAVERGLRYAVSEIVDLRTQDPTGSGDGSWIVEGYAAVFNERTTLYDGRFYKLEESIAPGAFTDVLARIGDPDPVTRTLVHLNYVHDMSSAVAATNAPEAIGRLNLSQDERGLWFTSRVDSADPDAVRMAVKMRRGVVSQASFAFTIDAEDTHTTQDDDGREVEHARITRVKNLYDVCVCPQGAYPQTVSMLRSLAAAIGRSPDGEGHPHRPLGGVSTIAEPGVVVATSDFARRKASAQAYARSRRVTTSHRKAGQ